LVTLFFSALRSLRPKVAMIASVNNWPPPDMLRAKSSSPSRWIAMSMLSRPMLTRKTVSPSCHVPWDRKALKIATELGQPPPTLNPAARDALRRGCSHVLRASETSTVSSSASTGRLTRR
jgi:hypothetical protein